MSDILQSITELDGIEIARVIDCECTDDLKKQIQINKSDITIFSQNIRSIYSNFDDFVLTLSSLTFEPDVIIFTECRLK